MSQYLLAKARNTVTGETVKAQDLTGGRFEFSQRSLAEASADQLAARLSARARTTWVGFVEAYTPTSRRG